MTKANRKKEKKVKSSKPGKGSAPSSGSIMNNDSKKRKKKNKAKKAPRDSDLLSSDLDPEHDCPETATDPREADAYGYPVLKLAELRPVSSDSESGGCDLPPVCAFGDKFKQHASSNDNSPLKQTPTKQKVQGTYGGGAPEKAVLSGQETTHSLPRNLPDVDTAKSDRGGDDHQKITPPATNATDSTGEYKTPEANGNTLPEDSVKTIEIEQKSTAHGVKPRDTGICPCLSLEITALYRDFKFNPTGMQEHPTPNPLTGVTQKREGRTAKKEAFKAWVRKLRGSDTLDCRINSEIDDASTPSEWEDHDPTNEHLFAKLLLSEDHEIMCTRI